MIRANQVYTTKSIQTVLPGVTSNFLHSIFKKFADYKIRSIAFSIRIEDNVTGLPLNMYKDETQKIVLFVTGNPAHPKIARDFSTKPVSGTTLDGSTIEMQPGQLFFDNFFVNEYSFFNLLVTNSHLMTTFKYTYSIVVEISEL